MRPTHHKETFLWPSRKTEYEIFFFFKSNIKVDFFLSTPAKLFFFNFPLWERHRLKLISSSQSLSPPLQHHTCWLMSGKTSMTVTLG